MSRLNDVQKLYREAKAAYYYSDKPIITDQEFDLLEKELRKLSPNDNLLGQVGANVSRATMLEKAKHEIPMTSLDNSRDLNEFRVWHIKSGSGLIVASEKRDGASVEIRYERGLYKQAITRGDGLIGEDISANAIMFANLPVMLPIDFTGSVRGEAQLSVENWQKLAKPGPNPRNTGNGVMRRKNSDAGECKFIEFFAFDVVGSCDFGFEAEKMQFLEAMGFGVTPWKLCCTVEDAIKWYNRKLADRSNLKYWIDGVVMKIDDLKVQEALGVSGGRPKGQTAFKFPFKGVETKVVGVTITVGHTGVIIPTARLEPVMIAGTTVKSALLNNWEEIGRLNVAIGDTVLVEKMGDIIPKAVGVVKRPATRTPILEPTICPICGGAVGREPLSGGRKGARTMCLNEKCNAKTVDGKLKNWIKKIDILGIGDARRAAMIGQLGVSTIADLYLLDLDELAACELENGREIGRKVAQTIYDNIHNKMKLSLNQFLGSLGIKYLGRSRVAHIREDVPGEFNTLGDWMDPKKLKTFANAAHIPGMVDAIINGIQGKQELIYELLALGIVVGDDDDDDDEPETVGDGFLNGEVVVFTGKIEKIDDAGNRYTRAMMEEIARDAGASTESKVRSNVTMLVQADPDSESSKTKKAKKQGCKIVAEADFWEIINE